MEPHQVLADKYMNSHRSGLAFSALPDAPVLAPRPPRLLRRQWTRVSSRLRQGSARGTPSPALARDRVRRSALSTPPRLAPALSPAECAAPSRRE